MCKVLFWELLFVFFLSSIGIAQQANTAMYILNVAPDARSGAMAGASVSTSPDANSQKSNSAKYIYLKNKYGISLSYVPWLTQITNDMSLSFGSVYASIGNDQVLGASFTYFSHGSTTLTSDNEIISSINSGEYAIDISYSRRLGKYLSAGIIFRYINTLSLTTDAFSPVRSVSAFGVDLDLYYRRPVFSASVLSLGGSLSNVGTKVRYSDIQQLFLPMNLNIGVTWEYSFLGKNTIAPTLEFVKALVPNSYQSNTSLFKAIGSSLSEMDNASYILGLEYCYNKMFAVRAGYRENLKSNWLSYYTVGTGFTYKFISLDAGYLLSTQQIDNALNNTLYMTLSVGW